ncbi:activating transcription factor 7-interacting protein 2 isoform X1 [Hydra vulgaris]|uniref:activating transcription factor 7-interacting protein 2 isoform X1 n=1 Tax=Hydra vulgaris TaxID=6087 RepID=UPI0032E9E53A
MTGSLNPYVEKELRRLKHTVFSNSEREVIKIEDDFCNMEYPIEKEVKQEKSSSVTNGSCNREMSDAAVQTETFDMVKKKETNLQSFYFPQNIKNLIKLRMSQYEAKAIKETVSAKELVPVLNQLQKENKALQTQLNNLRLKINENDKLKRPAEAPSNLYGKKVATEQINFNQSQNPNEVLQSIQNNRQQHPPVQLVAPVRQMPPPMHLQQIRPNEQMSNFIIVERGNFPNSIPNPILKNSQGVNTQVVAVNQGPRMTPITPDNRVHRLNSSAQTGGNLVAGNIDGSHFQLLQPPWHPPQQHLCAPLRYPPSYLIRQPLTMLLPHLKANISANGSSIVLTWDYDYDVCGDNYDKYKVKSYNLYAYQSKETYVSLKPNSEWKKIGVVAALALPMACTLSQIAKGHDYHFAVVAVDAHDREGPMSNPCYIRLNMNE